MTIAEYAPVKVTISFVFSDGEQTAEASFNCPPGTIPAPHQVADVAKSVREEVRAQIGEGFDWQNREDFVRDLFQERIGSGVEIIAVPGDTNWQAAWAREHRNDAD